MTDLATIVRQRLLEVVALRWSRRAVTVVAGPGFGKSVLLGQAIAENRLAPRGVDVELTCTPSDGDPTVLARHLAAVLDVRTGDLGQVGGELARRWPLGVCLVLDDVHHVTATPDGERALRDLLTGAPPAVHFLLAGRRPVPGLAAARAAGATLDLDEPALALNEAELAELARRHGVAPAALAPFAGWPAMAVLAASYGLDQASEFAWEAVLDHLDERQRRVLAAAATIGRVDAAVLAAACGTDGPDEVLADVPLVRRDSAGGHTVHELWRCVVGGVLTADERGDAVEAAAGALVDQGRFEQAFALCADHDRWDRAFAVLVACCRTGAAAVPREVLAGWLARLPAGRRDDPGGLLLRGLAGRVDDPFGTTTRDVLERAMAAYRDSGNVTGEVVAIGELTASYRIQGRAGDMLRLFGRVAELDAAGHVEAAGLMALVRSVQRELAGDDVGTLAALGDVPEGSLSQEWRAMVAYRTATTTMTLGDEAATLSAARRCAELAGATTMRHVLALAHWYAGDPLPALAALPAITADAGRSAADGVALGAFATMVLASSGQTAEASAQLQATERAAADGCLVNLMAGYLVGIRALLAAATGDDVGARDVIEAALARQPLSTPLGWQAASRWLVLAHVLVPDVRPVIEEGAAGMHRRRLAVARAVVAARDGGPLDGQDVAELSPALVATCVPLPWALTLAARLHEDGLAAGREIALWAIERHGQPARDALRVAATTGPVTTGAKGLLAAVAVAAHTIEVGVLGPAVLRIDGAVPSGLDWQRERVRALLLFFVVRGASRREDVAEALWPDLPPDAADRNLRVTLAYLQRVLEPDRRKGEPPFFLRQDGALLSLAGPPHLTVDAAVFATELVQAAEADRRGVPSVALELLEQATARWRGRCLEDVAFAEWAQPMVHQVTADFVQASVRAGELHLAAGRTADARRHARRALGSDAWCEPAHRVLVAAALADGDRAGAARALAACDAMLADLGVTPDADTDVLRRQVHVRTTAMAA